MASTTPPNEITLSLTPEQHDEYPQEAPHVGEFALLPTTQTTTVVTTTTVSTSFPPVIIKKPPRRRSDFDLTLYPLRDASTPKGLRNFSFELDGKPAVFTERDNSERALFELQEVVQAIRESSDQTHTTQHTLLEDNQPTSRSTLVGELRKRSQQDVSRSLTQSAPKRRNVSDIRHVSQQHNESTSPHAPRPTRVNRSAEILMEGLQSTSGQGSFKCAHSADASVETRDVRNDNAKLGTDLGSPQSLSLPSPSASPVLPTSDFVEPEHLGPAMSSCSNLHGPEVKSELTKSLSRFPQAVRMLELPDMLSTFDDLPQNVQSYVMYQLLKRCNKSTLQVVANIVNPALKRDFLDLLPYELSLHVMSYLDACSLTRAAQVSRRWRQLVDGDEYTWKNRLELEMYHVEDGEFERAIEEGWGFQNSLHTRRFSQRLEAGVSRLATTSQAPHIVRDHFAEMVDGGLKQPLVGQHLYKAIYKRHHLNYNAWMHPKRKPKQLSFESHGRHVVTCLQLDDDKIITGSEDSNINIFDVETGELRMTLEGHEGGVWALQYLGNVLVSGSTDRTVRLWDMTTGQCLQVFEGHTSTVRCLQILPVSKLAPGLQDCSHVIITGSRDSTLRVWKMPSAEHDTSTSVVTTNSSSPTERHNPFFVRTLSGHTQSVRALAAEHDVLVSGSYDCSVRIWQISSGRCLHRLNGHSQKVYSVVLDMKQNRCISGSMDCKVKIWDITTGSCTYTLEGHTSLVGLLSLSHERLVSAAADSTLRIWNPKNGKCIETLTAHTGAITCFQHDADKVISGSDGTLKLWDLRSGTFSRDLLVGLTYVWQVRFDQRRCVAAVQRNNLTYIEVLDFGAEQEDVPATARS